MILRRAVVNNKNVGKDSLPNPFIVVLCLSRCQTTPVKALPCDDGKIIFRSRAGSPHSFLERFGKAPIESGIIYSNLGP
jgi:hypothetical protein